MTDTRDMEASNRELGLTPESLRSKAKRYGWSAAAWAGGTAVGAYIAFKGAPSVTEEVPKVFVAGGIGLGILSAIHCTLESIDIFSSANRASVNQVAEPSE